MVGELIDGVFEKTISRNRHFLRTPPAIAIDKEIFDQLTDCSLIRIHEIERYERWETPYETFKNKSMALDRGFGLQLALTFPHWNVYAKDGSLIHKQRRDKPIPLPLPPVPQPTLFDI